MFLQGNERKTKRGAGGHARMNLGFVIRLYVASVSLEIGTNKTHEEKGREREKTQGYRRTVEKSRLDPVSLRQLVLHDQSEWDTRIAEVRTNITQFPINTSCWRLMVSELAVSTITESSSRGQKLDGWLQLQSNFAHHTEAPSIRCT